MLSFMIGGHKNMALNQQRPLTLKWRHAYLLHVMLHVTRLGAISKVQLHWLIY